MSYMDEGIEVSGDYQREQSVSKIGFNAFFNSTER